MRLQMGIRFLPNKVKINPLLLLATGGFALTLFLFIKNRLIDQDEKLELGLELFNPCSISMTKKSKIWSAPAVSGYAGKIFSEITYSYQDPNAYIGPVIKGWEPHRDRNLTPYVRPSMNTVILDPLYCDYLKGEKRSKLEMVIVQHSAPNNFNVRLANRATWMTFAKKMPEIKIIFVIGVPTVSPDDLEHIDTDLQSQIEDEHHIFGDILQVDSIESYSNNTLKSILSIKYLLGIDWKRMSQTGSPPRFIMRTDDDIYINLPLVQKLILQSKKWEVLPKVYNWPPMIGHILEHSPVAQIPAEKMSDKYAPKRFYECPTYFYDGTGDYIPYLQGAGYFIPWWSLPCLYQQSFQLPYFFIEDVFLGGWVAERCSVPKQHLRGFKMYKPNKPIYYLDPDVDILLHYVDKNYKVRAHRKFISAYQSLGNFV